MERGLEGQLEEKRLRQPGEGVAEMPMWTTITGTAEVRPPRMAEIKTVIQQESEQPLQQL